MQYILSEGEYNELRSRKAEQIKLERKKLLELCTQIADTMPITWSWGSGKDTPEPWGCIKTCADGDWYCDECPVQDICPEEYKEWSK